MSPRFFTAMNWMWFGIAIIYFFVYRNAAAGMGAIVMSELMSMQREREQLLRRLGLDSSCAHRGSPS